MDSGVDPGAEGLRVFDEKLPPPSFWLVSYPFHFQVTSTGLPKIIDILDTSGAGDIDTSAVAEIDSEGFVQGLTGRKLKVNPSWHPEDNKCHLGVVKLFTVVSEDYHDPWKKARKLDRWLPKQAEVTSVLMSSVQVASEVSSTCSASYQLTYGHIRE